MESKEMFTAVRDRAPGEAPTTPAASAIAAEGDIDMEEENEDVDKSGTAPDAEGEDVKSSTAEAPIA
jgi:hypothetical protein